jgi:hypothetical protein
MSDTAPVPRSYSPPAAVRSFIPVQLAGRMTYLNITQIVTAEYGDEAGQPRALLVTSDGRQLVLTGASATVVGETLEDCRYVPRG